MPGHRTLSKQLRATILGIASAAPLTACYHGTVPSSGFGSENVSPPKRENVKVVPLQELVQVRAFGLDGALVVAATPWWSEVLVGDILVMEVSEHTPEGSLRRVTSAQPMAGEITLETAQSVLTEVFEDGQLSLHVPLSASPIQEVLYAEEGLTVVPSGPVVPLVIRPGFRSDDLGEEDLSINFNNVILYDHDKKKSTTGDQIELNGKLSADLDMDLSVDIGWARIKRFAVSITAKGSSEVEVKASPKLVIKDEKSIMKAKLQPIVIYVVVPVVIVPTLELVATFDASVEAFSISASRKDAVMYTASLVREDEKWTPTLDEEIVHEWEPPGIGGVGASEVKVSIGPRVTTKVYALAGPSLDFMGSLRLELGDSLWRLYAGISSTLGIEFGIGDWDWATIEFEHTFLDVEKQIADGSFVPEICGDGEVNGAEDCDGTDLDGETCESQAAGSGHLGCTPECTFDLSGCAGMSCGDDALGDNEACDGDLIPTTCEGLGHDGGNLVCTPTCQLDESACCKNTCNPGQHECVDSAMRHCLAADNGCYAWDKWIPCPDGCAGDLCYNAGCPNGMIDQADGEECDGGNLGGQTCTTLGFDGGVLSCNGQCKFDASQCCDDGYAILNGQYPSTTTSASGCAVDNGVTLKLSVEDNGSYLRFRITKSDGTQWGAPATLNLYVGTGPTCGTPNNEIRGTTNVILNQTSQTIDLDLDSYVGWGEGSTKQFWVGKTEGMYAAGRATGVISIKRNACP